MGQSMLESVFLGITRTIEDTDQNRSRWWEWRRKHDRRLKDLLSNMEDLWFGPWKDLLLGGTSDHRHIRKDLEYVQPELLTDTIKKRRCYVGGKERFTDGIVSSLVSDLLNTVCGNEEDVDIRGPVILVQDSDIQMPVFNRFATIHQEY